MAVIQGDETDRNIEGHKGCLGWDTSNRPPNYPGKVKSKVKVKSANFKKIKYTNKHTHMQKRRMERNMPQIWYWLCLVWRTTFILFFPLPDFQIFCNALVSLLSSGEKTTYKRLKLKAKWSLMMWREEHIVEGRASKESEATFKVVFYSCMPYFSFYGHLPSYAESISLGYCKTILQFISSLPSSPWGCPSHAARAHPAANTVFASEPPVQSLIMMFCHIRYHSTVVHCSISFLNYSFPIFSSLLPILTKT